MKKTEDYIKEVAEEIVSLLLRKNKAYGDTANKPPQIFSKLSPKEAILARLDDKLSRIKTVGLNDKTEDTMLDLIGYLILYRVQLRKEQHTNDTSNTIQEHKGDGQSDIRRYSYSIGEDKNWVSTSTEDSKDKRGT
jgi:hypothetical protein